MTATMGLDLFKTLMQNIPMILATAIINKHECISGLSIHCKHIQIVYLKSRM